MKERKGSSLKPKEKQEAPVKVRVRRWEGVGRSLEGKGDSGQKPREAVDCR